MALFPDSIPADTDPAKLGASVIRALKTALNTIFGTYLNDDGTFKNNVVTGAALVDATVTLAKLDTAVAPAFQIPVGGILEYPGVSAPTNYLLCNGQAISRPIANGGTVDTYLALWNLFGTTYGSGDGSTTFNVPDKRGRVGVMPDGGAGRTAAISALGSTAGEDAHTLVISELPTAVGDLHQVWARKSGTGTTDLSSTPGNLDGLDTLTQGGGLAHNNVQPSIGMNYIIRYA